MQQKDDLLTGLLGRLEKQPALAILIEGVLLALLVAWVDILTGFEISLSFFYLIPITLVTWTQGERPGQAMAVLCGGLWLLASLWAGTGDSSRFVLMWNIATRLAIFLLVAALLARLHGHLRSETKLAHTDYLTGALNSRAFYERLGEELERARRYGRPFAVAYLDLDDFKAVNDAFGHRAGDAALRKVVETISRNTRSMDALARLGGDEFALLLPETGEEAGLLLDRLHKLLTSELNKDGPAITLSMGSTAFLSPPPSVDEAIRLVDTVMYRIKKMGKNAIEFNLYQEKVKSL